MSNEKRDMPILFSKFNLEIMEPAACLLPWLVHTDSLTQKLEQEAGEANLLVLSQQWVNTSWWAKYYLGVNTTKIMQREIIMSSRHMPCWYARTMIPDATYYAHSVFFERLKQESLGVIVFNDPSIYRSSLTHYSVDTSCVEYHWPDVRLTEKEHLLWLRLSEFTIQQKHSFYLAEILLPGLLRVGR